MEGAKEDRGKKKAQEDAGKKQIFEKITQLESDVARLKARLKRKGQGKGRAFNVTSQSKSQEVMTE